MKIERLLQRTSGTARKFLFALLVISLCAVAAPQPAAAACTKTHTVVAGDTVSSLSVKYDVSVAEIAAENSLKEPYTLYVGQAICIPASATTTPTSSSSSSTSTSKGPALKFSVTNNHLIVSVANYKKGVYYVKVGKKNAVYAEWVKLGRFRVRKDGAGSASFLLPKAMRGKLILDVCIKNASSDAVKCERLLQP